MGIGELVAFLDTVFQLSYLSVMFEEKSVFVEMFVVGQSSKLGDRD